MIGKGNKTKNVPPIVRSVCITNTSDGDIELEILNDAGHIHMAYMKPGEQVVFEDEDDPDDDDPESWAEADENIYFGEKS